MRTIVQRVTKAHVSIEGKVYASIGHGLLVYVCVAQGDEYADLAWQCKKIVALRIFNDVKDKFAYSVQDIQGSILLVPNFTLLAEVKKGNRPYFSDRSSGNLSSNSSGASIGTASASFSLVDAKAKYEHFVAMVSEKITTSNGLFGAKMRVDAQVDGPVNIIIDNPAKS